MPLATGRLSFALARRQLARMASSNSAPGSSRPASPAAAAVAAAATEPAPSSSSSAGGAFTKSPEELRLKPTSSVRDQLKGTLAADRTEDWGTRVLKDDADVFSMNGSSRPGRLLVCPKLVAAQD
jgi:hypothetical protein